CYVDGVIDGETPVDLVPDTAESVVTIGSWIGGGWLAGKIDEVALYDTALTDAEIATAMTGQATAVEPGGKLAVTWGSLRSN
ncbi:MAG: LamG-like jellyroll fold domain-containing protein, partial [Candidatus Poribacteria bacterium]